MTSPRTPLKLDHIRSTIARPSRPHTLLTTTSPRRNVRIWSYQLNAIPTTPVCPRSLCQCKDMPAGLDIDHEKILFGSMPPIAQHVVVRTGRHDWGRRIEEEASSEGTGVNFVKGLKELVGRGGKYFSTGDTGQRERQRADAGRIQRKRPVLITNCSLPPSVDPHLTSVHVFPQGLHVQKIQDTLEDREAFVSQFIGPKSAHARMVRAKRAARNYEAWADIKFGHYIDPQKRRLDHFVNVEPTILICGHNSRDTRCGILGPILHAQFVYCTRNIGRWTGDDQSTTSGAKVMQLVRETQVALTSHVGGHAFAGNVIIYIPRDFTLPGGERSRLAGAGIWYGRVEPSHVWGIVEKTFMQGTIIQKLLRGIHRIN